MEKLISKITRNDWIVYQWLEVSEIGTERKFMRGDKRTPDEAVQAADEWDFLESINEEED